MTASQETLLAVSNIFSFSAAQSRSTDVHGTVEVCKANAETLKQLATEAEIGELQLAYADYFNIHDNVHDGETPIIPADNPTSIQLGEICQGDLGMELEKDLSPESLSSNLGFRHGLPLQFLNLRHKQGLTAWQHSELFGTSPPPDCMAPMQLHWHQIAGVHSLARSVFTATPATNGNPPGMLICDEVGLGKTALSISILAFLNQTAVLQEQGGALPPFLGEFMNYICG